MTNAHLLTLRFGPPSRAAARGMTIRIPFNASVERGFRFRAEVTVREATVQEVGAWTSGEIDEMTLVCAMVASPARTSPRSRGRTPNASSRPPTGCCPPSPMAREAPDG